MIINIFRVADRRVTSTPSEIVDGSSVVVTDKVTGTSSAIFSEIVIGGSSAVITEETVGGSSALFSEAVIRGSTATKEDDFSDASDEEEVTGSSVTFTIAGSTEKEAIGDSTSDNTEKKVSGSSTSGAGEGFYYYDVTGTFGYASFKASDAGYVTEVEYDTSVFEEIMDDEEDGTSKAVTKRKSSVKKIHF